MPPRKKSIDLVSVDSAVQRAGSLTEQVYGNLKQEILRAQREPGTMLVEPELAVRYGVSKTPIREALQLLVREGWVTVLPRRGYQITPLSLSDVREVFALRQMVEPELAAQAAKRRNNVQLAALAELVEQHVHGNIERTLENQKAFHLLIAEMAGNGRAVTLLSGLLDEERRLHYLLPHLEEHLQTGCGRTGA